MDSIDSNYFLSNHPCEWSYPTVSVDFDECCSARTAYLKASKALRGMAFDLPGWVVIKLLETLRNNATFLNRAEAVHKAPI